MDTANRDKTKQPPAGGVINWYPGHMAKAKRLLKDQLSRVDAVLELCDARLPYSSRNPELMGLCRGKPGILLLNKADLAAPAATEQWLRRFESRGVHAFAISADRDARRVLARIEALTRDKVDRAMARGIRKTVRVMVVGVPNVGKSTLINRLHGRSIAAVSDRPGVTRANQWVKAGEYLEILDTPGLLWPRLDDQTAARRLAYIAAIRDEVINEYELACTLLEELTQIAPLQMQTRLKVTDMTLRGQALMEAVCRGRGFLLRGGECDLERAASVVLNEFRDGRMGRITLELPASGGREEAHRETGQAAASPADD